MTVKETFTPADDTAVLAAREQLLRTAKQVIDRGPMRADWESLRAYSPPPWYLDAKFGIFIHWVPAAVPAVGDGWYPRNMYLRNTPEHADHRAHYGSHPGHGYKDFLPLFTGAQFSPAEWIGLVRASGARFVVPVAEHHDGFAMYDTALSRWSASRIGPRRDVIAELAAEARDQGLAFGLSNHRAEHWWFFNGASPDADVHDPGFIDLYGPARPRGTQPDKSFLEDWLARAVETVQRYNPDLVFFDWWIEQPAFEEYLRTFAAYYYNFRGPSAPGVITYKWEAFAEGTAVRDIERGAVRTIQPRYFQNDTSTSRLAWTFARDNEFKPLPELIGDLADTVSKNGCLLLNIGPRADGTITEQECALLTGIGQWLAVNGEAIFESRPWLVYGEGPTSAPAGSFADAKAVTWTPADIRFTCRGDTLYATALAWPRDGKIAIRSLGTSLRLADIEVLAVSLLGAAEPVRWRRTRNALHVQLPLPGPGESLPCLKITTRPVPPPARWEPQIAD